MHLGLELSGTSLLILNSSSIFNSYIFLFFLPLFPVFRRVPFTCIQPPTLLYNHDWEKNGASVFLLQLEKPCSPVSGF